MPVPLDPLGMTPAAWESLVSSWGLPAYRARQIFDAFHKRLAREYAAMQVLPGPLRQRLEQEAPVSFPEVARREEAADGSVKLGLRMADGALIEAVFMPGEARVSLANEFADARTVAPTIVLRPPAGEPRPPPPSPSRSVSPPRPAAPSTAPSA